MQAMLMCLNMKFLLAHISHADSINLSIDPGVRNDH